MNENKIADLRKEISRQNQIIAGLLKLNEVLQKEISDLKTSRPISPTAFSDPIFMDGNNQTANADHNIEDGINTKDNADQINTVRKSDTEIAYQQIMVGINSGANPSSKTEVGISTITNGHYTLIPIDGATVSTLSAKLKRAGFLTVNSDGLRTAASLLLHFYNKGRGDYRTLRKITGLSTDGLAKTIMALKKRGAITRTAYQEFTVSANLSQLIQTTFQH